MIDTLIVLAAAAIPHGVIVEGSRGAADDRRALMAAMRAPQDARKPGRTYLCFDDAISRPAERRRVCRTRRDWQRLGLDPVV